MATVQDLTDTANTEFQLELKQYSEDREAALEQYKYDRDLKTDLMMKSIDQQFATQQADTQWTRQLEMNKISNTQDIEKLKMQQQFAV